MPTKIDHRQWLRLLWKGVGLHGSNFALCNSDADNRVVAAMLRILANEICESDDAESKLKAEAFINLVKADINQRA